MNSVVDVLADSHGALSLVQPTAPAVSVCGVEVTYGKEVAVNGVDLDVHRGEFVSLIGPSGCGKSTVLNAAAGLVATSSGHVLVDGDRVQGPIPSKAAVVFQDHGLFPWLTASQNVELALRFHGVARLERRRRAVSSLEHVGLGDQISAYPAELSGGMRQRVGIARAMSVRTPLILMDEPFGALDEQTRTVLGEELSSLLAGAGKTILLVTHSLAEAVFLSDRIAVMSGRPGTVTSVIDVDEPHPRRPSFMTTERFHRLRDELFALLHDEMRTSVLGWHDEDR